MTSAAPPDWPATRLDTHLLHDLLVPVVGMLADDVDSRLFRSVHFHRTDELLRVTGTNRYCLLEASIRSHGEDIRRSVHVDHLTTLIRRLKDRVESDPIPVEMTLRPEALVVDFTDPPQQWYTASAERHTDYPQDTIDSWFTSTGEGDVQPLDFMIDPELLSLFADIDDLGYLHLSQRGGSSKPILVRPGRKTDPERAVQYRGLIMPVKPRTETP